MAATAAWSTGAVEAQSGEEPSASGTKTPEYYLLRKYGITRAQAGLCDRFLESALVPALGRLGYPGVGAFSLDYGPETPAIYLLLRHADAGKLLRVEDDLLKDEVFVAAARPFRTAPALQPAFQRVENTLLHAFAGHPLLTTAGSGKRILQLRTYESPSVSDYLLKVQMFHSGEFEIFAECGMHAVFYAHTLIGPRMPSLTYMLQFASLAELEQRWAVFRENPAWRKLSTDPRFSKEDLVSNITNLVLSPKPYSAV